MDYRDINHSRYFFTWELEISNGYHPKKKKKSNLRLWKEFVKWLTMRKR